MSWKDSTERKIFKNNQKQQEDFYKKVGMTDYQIEEMKKFDLGIYKSNRKYFTAVSNEEEINLTEFADAQTYVDAEDEIIGDNWIENIDDKKLYEVLKNLDQEQIELLKYLYLYNYNLEYTAKNVYGCSVSALHKRLHNVFNIIRNEYSFGGVKYDE